MSDYEQNPINGSQPPQGDSQPNTGYTPYQQPGTYYTPPQPEQPQTPPTGDNGTTYHYAYHSGNQPGAGQNQQRFRQEVSGLRGRRREPRWQADTR